jgi:hypothetical protein
MKKLLSLFLLITFVACNTNQHEVETNIMNCIYSGYDDDGIAFKQLLKDFEKTLIADGVLADGTGDSYLTIFKKIAENNNVDFNSTDHFPDRVANLPATLRNEELDNCQQQLTESLESKDFKGAKLSKVMNAMGPGDIDFSKYAGAILEILDAKDFEHDYYKMTVFSIVSLLDNDTNEDDEGLTLEEDALIRNRDLEKAINVYLNTNSKIEIDKIELTLDKTAQVIYAYAKESKEVATYNLTANTNAIYQDWIDLQNTIIAQVEKVRDEVSKQEHNSPFSNISEEKQEVIKRVYPLIIIEDQVD